MIGWVFSVEGLVDKLTRKGGHLVVNKTVIYMRGGVLFGLASMVGRSCVLCRYRVGVGKVLCYFRISGPVGTHIEISRNECWEVGYFFNVIGKEQRALYLTLVSKAIVGVHVGEKGISFLIFQYHVNTDTVMTAFVPAL